MLYIVATPIGNLEDITLRALRILREADLILAEDTRKTGRLLANFEIKKPLESFYEHNEQKKIPAIIARLDNGASIALVSAAGTPTISDPGYKLVRACRGRNLAVTSVPGASSAINALALTSLPHDKNIFLGYLPRKPNARRRLWEEIKTWRGAVVFFESPYRLESSLEDARAVLGNKPVAVTREMTKKFEEVLEATLEEAIAHFRKHKPRGEFTVVVDNRPAAD